ncbi:MAG: RND transporter [Chitinophagales bacterium]|nr:MAG: RND transporter [Chitinophagales bacterium]
MKILSWKTLTVLVLAVVVLIVLTIVGVRKGWIGKGGKIEVVAEKVARHTIVETVSASGKIFPETEVKISPDVSGEITVIYYQEGDSVSKGNLLLEIRPDIYQSVVEQAEAALNQARASLATAKARLAQVEAQFENAQNAFNRNEQLYRQKVISQMDYDNAVAAFKVAQGEKQAAEQSVRAAEFTVRSAEAALKEAKDNLAKTKVYAPVSGIISKLNVKEGERVVGTAQFTGTEMLTIADLNRMEVHVEVSENDISRVSVGDTADIEVDAFLDKKFKGIVRHIAHSASAGNVLTSEQVTNFTVKISILASSYASLVRPDNPFPFRPGMSATAEIKTDVRENALAVPIQSVTIREEEKAEGERATVKKQVVFVIDGNRVKMIEVKTGIQDDRYIEITEGLEEGQEVVSGPYRAISRLLEDGSYVEKVKQLKENKLHS